jgi:hypothetical protein
MVTPSSVSFSVTRWGGRIDSSSEPDGRLFLANVFQPGDAGFDVRVRLIGAGYLIAALDYTVPIPEPTAWLLGCSNLIAFGIAYRRRRRPSGQLRLLMLRQIAESLSLLDTLAL